MPTFSYSAVDTAGNRKTGLVEANDEKAAIAAVLAEGRYVTEIEQSAAVSQQRKTSSGEKKKNKSTKHDLALYTRRMSDLSAAGLPLDRVLAVMAEQTEALPLVHATEDVLEDVRGGMAISDALSKHPKLFSDVYCQTLAAGEASGQFPESAERLADLLENEVARRSQVVSALVYPAVLSATAVFVVVFLLTFVVPRLQVVFDGLGDSLPAPTKILLGVTSFITGNWVAIVVGIVALVVGVRIWSATEAGAVAKDRLLMNLPMGGPIVKKAVVSRYARVLGTLVYGGVPILEALRLAGLASGNKVFSSTSDQVQNDVREGRGIAQSMEDTGAFPPVLTHMVAIGEETGDLPKMLNRVSTSLDFEVEQSLRRLTSSLEPVIVLVMGGFVAFVVLSVLLPIFSAQDLVK
ncbi:MAG: type II secretion system F family protein [Armatimonadetes bacterium]|nr:type II secretion system F family protein [Armatimonadota bacterium]